MNIKKILTRTWEIIQLVGVPVLTVVGGTRAKVAGAALSAVPSVVNLFKRKDSTVNPLESAIREIISLVVNVKNKSGIELMMALVPLLLTIQKISGEIKGFSKAEFVPKVREALDNLIGSEPDALIGPNGQIVIDIKYVDEEKLSDLIIEAIEEALLAQE